jgi:hypothetical protein
MNNLAVNKTLIQFNGLNPEEQARLIAELRDGNYRPIEVPHTLAAAERPDCRICLYQGFLDPPETQLIFWQGDVAAIASDLKSKGLQFEKTPARGEDGGIGALLRDPDGRPIYFVNLPGVTRQGSA